MRPLHPVDPGPGPAPQRWRRWAGGALALGVAWLHVAMLEGWRLTRKSPPTNPTPPASQAVLALPSPRPPTTAEPTPAAPSRAARAPASPPIAPPPITPPTVPAAATAQPGTDAPPTRLPPAQVLHFRLDQGGTGGPATLAWAHHDERYTLSIEGPAGWRMHSQGRLDAFGLAPERYTEQRPRRSERALTMEAARPDQTGRVAYSTRSEPGPLSPGLQDRLSWLLQLQAWLGAQPHPAGASWSLRVASPGGDQQDWRLQLRSAPSPAHATDGAALYLVHEPQAPYDNRVELWLEASPPHWPLRLVLSAARGEPLVLNRAPAALEPDSTLGPEAPK